MQSLPSRSATSGRAGIGPFTRGGRMPSQIRSSRCRFTLCRSMSRAGSRRSAPRRNGGGTRRCSPPAPAAKRKGRAAAPRPRSRGGLAAAAPLASASGCPRRGPPHNPPRRSSERGPQAAPGRCRGPPRSLGSRCHRTGVWGPSGRQLLVTGPRGSCSTREETAERRAVRVKGL